MGPIEFAIRFAGVILEGRARDETIFLQDDGRRKSEYLCSFEIFDYVKKKIIYEKM